MIFCCLPGMIATNFDVSDIRFFLLSAVQVCYEHERYQEDCWQMPAITVTKNCGLCLVKLSVQSAGESVSSH